MFYVTKSNSKFLMDKIIDKIIEAKKVEKDNIHFFDFEEKGDFEKAFSEYLTFDFNNKKKIVILKNSSFINLVSPEKSHMERFEKSIKIDSKNTMVFAVEKLNKTGKINKKFSSEFKLIEKESPTNNDLIKFIEHFFSIRKIKISPSSSKKIIEKLNNDFDLIVSEIKKLELITTTVITNELIDSVVIDFSKENLFKLASSVLTLNIEKVSSLINKLISQGEEFYLVGEKLVNEFSKALRYKLITDIKKISNNEFQRLTN